MIWELKLYCVTSQSNCNWIDQEAKFKVSMSSPDIRAGVSLIAALAADGESTIHNVEQIDRGYEKIDERLNSIGAKIEKKN